ncbi:MAG: hypothetical protein ACK4UN_07500 [Limisphaerales bacterium]
MRRLFVLFGALILSVTYLAGQVTDIAEVEWKELPGPVQQVIQMHAGVLPSIESGMLNGQTVYSVPVQNGGATTRLLVNEAGTILPQPSPPPAAMPVVAPTPEAVPPVVAQPEGVTEQVVGGQSIYTVRSGVPGQRSYIAVSPNARVLAIEEEGPFGTQLNKVPWVDLPPAVRNTFLAQAAPGQILDITRATVYGQSIYEIVYAQYGQRERLRISENGAVFGQVILSPEDARIVEVEPFIGFNQIPVVVQTTLRVAAGNQPIESVRQEVIDGRITYVGVFRENGVPVSLRISQTGQILR